MCSAGTTKKTTSHAENVQDSDVPLLRGTHLVGMIPLGTAMVQMVDKKEVKGNMVQLVDQKEITGNVMQLQMVDKKEIKGDMVQLVDQKEITGNVMQLQMVDKEGFKINNFTRNTLTFITLGLHAL